MAKRKSKRPSPVVTTIKLSSDMLVALDACVAAGIFPHGANTRAARIRWLVINFLPLYRRFAVVHGDAVDTATAVDAAVVPLMQALREFLEADVVKIAGRAPAPAELELWRLRAD